MATINISNIGLSQTIEDLKPLSTVENIVTHSSIVSGIALLVTVEEILPFMLSITNIGIEGYSPSNPPVLGIQVIGLSNYIL